MADARTDARDNHEKPLWLDALKTLQMATIFRRRVANEMDEVLAKSMVSFNPKLIEAITDYHSRRLVDANAIREAAENYFRVVSKAAGMPENYLLQFIEPDFDPAYADCKAIREAITAIARHATQRAGVKS